jgi:hypothetical protein
MNNELKSFIHLLLPEFLLEQFLSVKMDTISERGDIYLEEKSTVPAEYHIEGYPIIQKYSKAHKWYCLDDLGVEQNVKQYGNECNTMAEILLNRYELFVNHGIQTHATTNLNADDLETIYGNRVRSRFRSMFNLIDFPIDSPDKR